MEDKPIQAVTFDIIPVPEGVLISRGSVRVLLEGADAEFFACAIADIFSVPSLLEDILEEFNEEDRESLTSLVSRLLDKGFLRVADPVESIAQEVQDPDSPENIFFWHFRETKESVAEKLKSWNIVIVGVNFVTTYLIERLQRLGHYNITVLDDPSLRNHRFFSEEDQLSIDLGEDVVIAGAEDESVWEGLQQHTEQVLVVATCDFGGGRAFRYWNEMTHGRGLNFLPVSFQGFKGQIGPLVRPGSGACYECYRARENANLENISLVRAGEKEDQLSQSRIAGFVDPMLAILSGMAAMEILKITAGIILSKPSSVISISTLNPSVSSHRVLRVPRCRVCSPTQWRPETNLKRNVFRAKLAKEST